MFHNIFRFPELRKTNREMARPNNKFFPQPAEISYKGLRFLITDRPHNANVSNYVDTLRKHRVTDLVRVAESEYDLEPIKRANINVVDLVFPDGQYPPDSIVKSWFELLKARSKDENCCFAIHCVAGLGRAPVLVAIALIELGMTSEDTVELIRSKRRGAINAKQLDYLHRYKSKNRLKKSGNQGMCCVQ